KVKQLEEDKKDVENRKLNTRAGYVYVISNIGSFGEGIYKIGLTRRLEPYDRVKELGDASVPFEFDVHAMIFSDDAPTLENTLHKHFRDRELNKVNHRKEFFKVDIDEIEEVVKNNHNKTVEFTKIPVAEQYWESQNIMSDDL
ncbi:GIY-YIG nuclease family protein, partial [Staphylococcus hominis]|nr:GIY-YIG nuclease family protein [Staphylococcus hominis]